MQDILYALRALRRSPLASTVVVASLALAIGANTAVFNRRMGRLASLAGKAAAASPPL